MNETRMVSIDSSTKKTGMAFWENGKLVQWCLVDFSKESDAEVRLKKMICGITEKLNEFQPHIVALEDDWNKQNVSVTKMLSEIIGSVHGYCLAKDIDFYKFMPSTWRSLVGFQYGKLKREALKQLAIDYIKEKYNIDANDDTCESICIGEACITYLLTFE